MEELKQAYPLAWPVGQPRTRYPKSSNFSNHTVTQTHKEITRQLKLMGARNIVVSTNIPLKQDGTPRADYQRRTIEDKGIAIHFIYNGNQRCMACDKWDTIEDNLWAMALSLDSMRGLERWGVSDILNRAFEGFKAITEVSSAISYWDVLDMEPTKDETTIRARYKELVTKTRGDETALRDLNVARDEALKQCN